MVVLLFSFCVFIVVWFGFLSVLGIELSFFFFHVRQHCHRATPSTSTLFWKLCCCYYYISSIYFYYYYFIHYLPTTVFPPSIPHSPHLLLFPQIHSSPVSFQKRAGLPPRDIISQTQPTPYKTRQPFEASSQGLSPCFFLCLGQCFYLEEITIKFLLRRGGMEEAVAPGTAYSETCSLLSMQMAQVVASPSKIIPDGILCTFQLNSKMCFCFYIVGHLSQLFEDFRVESDLELLATFMTYFQAFLT